MDKASLKEIYDNRDLIAQIFDLKAKFDNLPNHEELVAYKQMYDKFLSMYNENIMYTDKVCEVTVQHVYDIAPRRNVHLDFDNLGDNSFVHKRALREKVDEEINALSLKTLQLGNKELQIVTGPVKFIGDVTLEKGNFAWLDKQNTFSWLQTFSQGITSNGASIFSATTNFIGLASFKEIEVANKLTLSEGSQILGDKCIFTNLSIAPGPVGEFNGIYDQYDLIVKQKMVVGDTTLPENATFKVKGNTVIDGNLSASGSFEFGNTLLTNTIMGSGDRPTIKGFQMIDMGGSENCIKTLMLLSEPIQLGQRGVISNFNEIDMHKGEDSKITTRYLYAQYMYTVDKNNNYEVINTNTHYIFDNQRPVLSGTVGDPQPASFVTLADVQKITPHVKEGQIVFDRPSNFRFPAVFNESVTFNKDSTFNTNPKVANPNANDINYDDNNLLTFGQIKEVIKDYLNISEHTWVI